MKEQIKIALLAVIAATLIVNTYTQMSGGTSASSSSAASNKIVASNNKSKPASTIAEAKDTFDPLKDNKAKATSAIDNSPKTTMTFGSYEHDFGNVQQDSENKYVFSFTNTGKEPLIIENAKGSCGCTVPQYPKEPIPPGGKGEIEVVYKPGKQKAQQNKTVTVTANTEPTNTILKIKAMVEEV